jgi:hypothetical protein
MCLGWRIRLCKDLLQNPTLKAQRKAETAEKTKSRMKTPISGLGDHLLIRELRSLRPLHAMQIHDRFACAAS